MLGWTADTAAAVNEAVAKFSARVPDVVVIDLCLEEPDLMHLSRHLRYRHADPSVIFVSGAGGRIHAAASRAANTLGLRVAGTMGKPIDPYRLHGLLLSNPVRPPAEQRQNGGGPTAEELDLALRNDEIHTEFQPKTDLLTGEIVGVEALAHALGLHVVAEGIETEDVSDRLRDIGCDMGQGWFYVRPMAADAIPRWPGPGTNVIPDSAPLSAPLLVSA